MPDEKPTMPTAEDVAAGGEVVNAGATAAAAEKDPAKRQDAAATAIKDTAEQKGFKLSPEDAEQLAGMVAAQVAATVQDLPDKTADKISERGGFDRLPEPVSPPPAPTGTGSLPAQPPAAAEDEAPPQQSRGASAFARRFRGG
jgi:hypothetical protein